MGTVMPVLGAGTTAAVTVACAAAVPDGTFDNGSEDFSPTVESSRG